MNRDPLYSIEGGCECMQSLQAEWMRHGTSAALRYWQALQAPAAEAAGYAAGSRSLTTVPWRGTLWTESSPPQRRAN